MEKRITAVFIDPDLVILDNLIEENWLCEITDSALNHLEVAKNESIEIAITNDQTMRDLNLRHLGIDSTTDVLSFSNINPIKRSSYSDQQNDIPPKVIGEVVISIEQAGRQAAAKSISFKEEVAFLLAHGILHLLGYDHEADDDRIQMENLHRKTLYSMLGKASMQINVDYLA
ncbi:MAG: rRNA maturation RNase YbeY [Dehalococcoidia bacterium]|nr:rRNA maturation RNase YbeY [Dehalococcoidia bacterium]MQG16557.1 rRNA maturation RNase YbeY [SAR202 cluster bacterium]